MTEAGKKPDMAGMADMAPSPRELEKEPMAEEKPVEPSDVKLDEKDPLDVKDIPVISAVAIFIAVLLPAGILVVCFSAMGIGLQVYSAMAPSSMNLIGNCCAFLAASHLALLYILDYQKLHGCLRVFLALITVCLLLAAAVFKGVWYPWAAMLFTLLMSYVIIGDIRVSHCHLVKRRQFYGVIGASTGIVSFLLLAAWLGWMASGNAWTEETKAKLVADTTKVYQHVYTEDGETQELIYALHCAKGVDLYDWRVQSLTFPRADGQVGRKITEAQEQKISKACSVAATVWFISWMAPFIGITVNAVVAAFCGMVVLMGKEVTQKSKLEKSLKKFLLLLTAFIAGMYGSVYASGGLVQLGSAFMAFCAAASAALMVWLYLEVPSRVLEDIAHESKLIGYLLKAYQHDAVRAFAIIMLNMLIPLFFFLDICRKSVRRCRGKKCASGVDGEEEMRHRNTEQGRRLWLEFEKWDWVSVCGWVHVIGEAFFGFIFGMKATYIFFSWLNGVLADVAYGLVFILVGVIGFIMFLLPPVPGSAVYMFAGIVIGSKSQNESIGFLPGTILGTVLALVTKLCACTGQYGIGYGLGGSVKVQQLIGVDKVPTRALEKILKQTGLKPGKVAILVGGPDWPTSVTCGILKLSIPQMLIGTLPVYFVSIAPQTLMGAMLTKETGESGLWTMVAAMCTGISVVGQIIAMCLCVYYTTNEIEHNHEELAKPRDEHKAVEELSRKEETFVNFYKEVTNLKSLYVKWPMMVYLIAASVVLQLISFFVFAADFVLTEKLVFNKFAMKNRIDETYEAGGLNGNVLNLIMPGEGQDGPPTGHITLAIFGFATLLHICYSKALAGYAKRNFANKEVAASSQE